MVSTPIDKKCIHIQQTNKLTPWRRKRSQRNRSKAWRREGSRGWGTFFLCTRKKKERVKVTEWQRMQSFFKHSGYPIDGLAVVVLFFHPTNQHSIRDQPNLLHPRYFFIRYGWTLKLIGHFIIKGRKKRGLDRLMFQQCTAFLFYVCCVRVSVCVYIHVKYCCYKAPCIKREWAPY